MQVPRSREEYVFGEVIGHGGMGTVFRAWQPSRQRDVAIKVLRPELALEVRNVERFRAEALAGARISHPNVARVIDSGEMPDGTLFLVMDYVAGETLGTILAREGVLSPRRGCALGQQILEALDGVHHTGVVHADVKSDNVIVGPGPGGGERAVLIDFGVAWVPVPETHPTLSSTLSGTPEYLAPEVIAGAAPTPTSDLYAVGVILYELLTGETPFHADTLAAVLDGHLERDVVSPSLRRPEAQIPAELDAIVLRALAKDPAMRPESARRFAIELSHVPTVPEVVESHPPRPFSSEAPTQDLETASTEHAAGSASHPRDPEVPIRAAIARAITAGALDGIASGYLSLARLFVGEHRLGRAARELEQAIDVLTTGAGPDTRTPPPPLWRVLLVLAAIHDGNGDVPRARATAAQAHAAAMRVGSAVGGERARALQRRLECGHGCSPP